jgi:hypothetical protein
MKNKFYYSILILMFFITYCFPQDQNYHVAESTYVSSAPEAKISIVMPMDSIKPKLDSSQYSLNNGNGEKVICNRVYCAKKKIDFFFKINQSNFYIFEKMISNTDGYFIDNKECIKLRDTVLQPSELRIMTLNKIGKISKDSWKKYVYKEYSTEYFFPQEFDIGIDPNLLGSKAADSAQTIYYIHLVQSGSYVPLAPIFWGVKARWSTGKEDKANFIQLYPITFLIPSEMCKLALFTGVETGYYGFEKQGRAILKADARYRLPFNPLNLTLGFPRVRIFPMMSLSVKGNIGWANASLPDSLKNGYDLTGGIQYGVPLSKSYYIQFDGNANFASATKRLQYHYDMSFGYIANGTLRIAAAFEQGYQEVSYQFDRKLLINFAFDILNTEIAK